MEPDEPSSPNGATSVWVDLTQTIRSCAKGLTLTEPFVCDRTVFNLHDAMAATQLMDRKMDSCDVAAPLVSPLLKGGLVDADKVLFPRPAPTGIADDFTVLDWEDISLEQATVVVVEILVRLTALLSGASIGESTFTCLYCHKPVLLDMHERLTGEADNLADAFKALNINEKELGEKERIIARYVVCAAAFCLVETTAFFRDIVHNADVYEEEDFSSNAYGISLDYVFDYPTRTFASTALELLAKAPPSPHRETTHHALAFMSSFLFVCSTMAKLTRNKMTKVVQDVKQKVQRAINHIKDLEGCLDTEWIESSRVYARVKEKAFDSYVNRPLVGNAPVRKIFFLDPLRALSSLRTVTDELDWAVCRLLLEGNTIGRITRILDRVSECDTNILSRSLIVLNLYFDERLLGQYDMQTALVQNMKQWQHMPESLLTNEHAEAFLARLAKPVYDTLKLRASNRNRQRVYIEAVMFQDWVSLQNEANLVDTHYRGENSLDNSTPPFFGYYVLVSLCRLMGIHLQSAIEMGLFCGHGQLCSAFWYRDFLLASLEQNLVNMKRGKEFFQRQQMSMPGKAESKGKKKRNSKQKPQHIKIKKTPEELEEDLELKVIDLKRKLCRGLVRFIICLRKGGYLKTPTMEFTSERKQYEKRFEPYSAIRHPPFLTYDDYLAGADASGIAPDVMLADTADLFQAAKAVAGSILQELSHVEAYYAPIQEEQVRALLKVSVGNAVYVMKLRQLYGKTETMQVSYDFDDHKEFCTIKISE